MIPIAPRPENFGTWDYFRWLERQGELAELDDRDHRRERFEPKETEADRADD